MLTDYVRHAVIMFVPALLLHPAWSSQQLLDSSYRNDHFTKKKDHYVYQTFLLLAGYSL